MVPKQLGALDPEGQGAVHPIRFLLEGETRLIADSIAGLHRYQAEEQLFHIVERNVKAFDAFAVDALVDFAEGTRESLLAGIPPKVGELLTIEANRHFLNALASVRMYVDHVEAMRKRQFGAASPEFETFRAACAREYDGNPSYAFVYKLRNYTQHYDLPIARALLSASRKVISDRDAVLQTASLRGKQGQRSLSFYLSRKELLAGFEWPPSIRAYIRSLADDIEARGQLGSAYASLTTIHAELSRGTVSDAATHARALAVFVIEVHDAFPKCAPVVLFPAEGGIRIEGFPMDEIQNLVGSPKAAGSASGA